MNEIFGMTDLDTISSLADIINSKELSEITITEGGRTITIKGRKCIPAPPHMGMPPMNAAAPAPAPQTAAAPAADEANGGNIVKAPIVGTYYRSPSPDKPPFVKIGDKVNIKCNPMKPKEFMTGKQKTGAFTGALLMVIAVGIAVVTLIYA